VNRSPEAADLYDRALRLARQSAAATARPKPCWAAPPPTTASATGERALDHAERVLAAARECGLRLLEAQVVAECFGCLDYPADLVER